MLLGHITCQLRQQRSHAASSSYPHRLQQLTAPSSHRLDDAAAVASTGNDRRAPAAWITVAAGACPTESCRSRDSRFRSASRRAASSASARRCKALGPSRAPAARRS